jgi:hypothetical protein
MTAWRASTGAPGLAVGLAREFDGSSSPSFVTYTVYIQDRTVPKTSEVLTIRVPPDLGRRLAREARRQRRTRSDVARQLLDRALSSGPVEDPDTEAKRQSGWRLIGTAKRRSWSSSSTPPIFGAGSEPR